MFIFLFILMLMTSPIVSFAQDVVEAPEEKEVFVYDDHGNRDPFWALVNSNGMIVNFEKDMLVSDLLLEGIIAGSGDDNMAIINGRVVQTSDKIGDFKIQKITVDVVVLYKGEQRFELKLKKEE